MHSTVSHEGTNAPLSHITITLIIIVPMNMVATIIITIGIVFKTLARGSDKGGTDREGDIRNLTRSISPPSVLLCKPGKMDKFLRSISSTARI